MKIFIDTNVYLKFYHYSNDELEELRKLIVLIEQGEILLYVPSQVFNEFTRNREVKIADALKTFKEDKLNNSFPIFLKEYPEYELMKKAIAEYQKNKRIVLENIKIAIESNSLKADEIIKELFEKAEIIEANESLINSAKVRFDLGNPPGKNNSYGDALNWETLLQDTSIDKDLIFISDDKDYFSEIDNAKFNKYLEREWENRKNSKIIFFKSISEFFKSKYPNIKLASDLQKDVYIEHLQNSNTFRDSRYNLHKLSKFNDFTSDQINSIFFQTFSNTQLYWISEDEDINEILYDLYDKYNSVMDEFIKTEFLSKVKRIKQIDNENESEDDFPF
jgi:predicted nucleic acid-binding protein